MAPPLDADFFDQVARANGILTTADRDLLQFIRTEFGFESWPTLEEFFTQVSAIDRFHNDFNIRGRVSKKFERHLNNLRSLIPRVFSEALAGRNCVWHERIAHALRSKDSVLSFNYDTLIDSALTAAAGNRWRPESGYGFSISHGLERWTPEPRPGRKAEHPIRLLKPHGSLNWSIDDGQVRLVKEYSEGTSRSIVPPTWDKSDVANPPWREVWRQARRALGQARVLVVIGYSVPQTDQLSQALLRADVSSLRGLVLVNPSAEARSRMRSLLSSAMGVECLVAELETLEDLANHLDRSPTEAPVRHLGEEHANLRSVVSKLGRKVEDAEWILRDIESLDVESALDRLESDIDVLKDASGELEQLRGDVADLEQRIESLNT